MTELENEEEKLTELLKGQVVKLARRHRSRELVVEFEDGTRLFVDQKSDGLEFSVTG